MVLPPNHAPGSPFRARLPDSGPVLCVPFVIFLYGNIDNVFYRRRPKRLRTEGTYFKGSKSHEESLESPSQLSRLRGDFPAGDHNCVGVELTCICSSHDSQPGWHSS